MIPVHSTAWRRDFSASECVVQCFQWIEMDGRYVCFAAPVRWVELLASRRDIMYLAVMPVDSSAFYFVAQ